MARKELIDPTKNVLDLTSAANQRQDDLRAAHEALAIERAAGLRREMDLRAEHQRSFAILRAQHASQTLEAEARRTNALRELDRNELRSATDRYQVAVDALSRETKQIAETLRASVEGTRKALADVYDAKNRETDSRLSAVERFQAAGSGKGAGLNAAWVYLGGLVALLAGLYALGSKFFGH